MLDFGGMLRFKTLPYLAYRLFYKDWIDELNGAS